MKDRSNRKYGIPSYQRLIRFLIGIVLIAVLFGIGIFFSRAFDQRVMGLVSELRSVIKQKHGISMSIGQVETDFGSLHLSEVTIGEPSWMVVDRIDVSISFNPFQSFLKPSSMTIGRAMVKVPWKQALWPKEVKTIYDLLKRRQTGELSPSGQNLAGSYGRLIPNQLMVNAARIEIADGDVTKFLSEDLKMDLSIKAKMLSVSARRLQILDVIDESLVEGDLKFADHDLISFAMLGRLSQGGESTWAFSCDSQRDISLLSCQVDAAHLPKSVVRPLQRFVGADFAPSFRGAVSLERTNLDISPNTLKVNIDGTCGDIFVENPTLALGVVGPSFLTVKVQSEVDYDQQTVKIFPSNFELSSVHISKQKSDLEKLPVNLSGEIRLEKSAKELLSQPSGFIDLSIPTVDCQAFLRSLPQSFISELSGIRLGGAVNLEMAATLVHGVPELKIKNSLFRCDALSVPEIYSSIYLNGPFNIERNLPNGKIYIPVDPARPYFSAYNDVPSLVRAAFVSSEDAGFFQHKGVEISAIIGAVERNSEEGRAAVGGSTITMQTVKNLFLARDKTISRKVQEIFLAWHLDRTISKERILEIYLNMVEFGPGLYGLGMASQRFFGKSPKELSLKQAIYLASLLPAPVPRYRYFCKGEITANYDRILRQLLDRMLGLGRISAAQHAEALAEKIIFSQLERESACGRHDYAGSESESEF